MKIDELGSSGNEAANIKNRVNQYRGTGLNFGDLIREKVQPQELKFSAHAENRIRSRGIDITPELKEQLNRAISDVAAKGGRDTAVIAKEAAFIVNVPNRTVVTAMDRDGMRENVITNIDSATII